MVKIQLHNSRSQIVGPLHTDPEKKEMIQRALRNALSYESPSKDFSPAYKAGTWDGKFSLWNQWKSTFPTGLRRRVIETLERLQIPFTQEDKRAKPTRNALFTTAFAEHGRELRFYQSEAAKRGKDFQRGLLALATGAGKCLALNTPIRTVNGWTTMGAIQDGEMLFDERGQPTEVVKAHDVIEGKPCYEITFSTGETVIACDEHQWTVRVSPAWLKEMPSLTLSTQDLYDVMNGGKRLQVGKYIKPFQKARDTSARAPFFIDAPEALYTGEEEKLPIDPYIFGCWLGDGGANGNHFTSIDDEITDELAKRGLDLSRSKFNGYKEWNVRGLQVPLRALGVINNKHIPPTYLNASLKQRFELLQGIMDTDGTVCTRGRSEISVSDEKLADDILELVRGLGILASKTVNASYLNGIRHKDRHRIKFATRQPVFRLSRKRARLTQCQERPTNRRIYIKSIRPVESVPVRCLTVDSPNRLFLVGNTLVPTHNTLTACEMIALMGVAPVVFIVPSINLLLQTKKEFEKFLRIDGKPPKIGMAGDGICDLNPNGINIITYQTALVAFGEVYQKSASKRGKADSVVKANEKKTTAQLEKEFFATEEVLKAIQRRMKDSCANEYIAWNDAIAAADSCCDAQKQERLEKVVTTKHNIYQRKLNSTCSKEQAAFKKAESYLKTRQLQEARYSEIRSVIELCQCLVVDEAHLAAAVIERLGEIAVNAFYRIGLTATPFREDNQEIRIEGALGRKLIEVSSSDLIEMGFQCPLNAYVVDVDYIENSDGYRDAYEKHIIRNWKRNWYIKRFAEDFHKEGMPVWIYVDELAHGELLEAMIPNSVFVAGGDEGDGEDVTEEEENYRKAMLDKCERGEIILITTKWAATGIDAVKLRVGILAGSVQAASTIKQAIGRILRCVGKDIEESRANGKPNAIWVSFMDEQEHLHKHSLRQVRVYKTERAWKVTRIRG